MNINNDCYDLEIDVFDTTRIRFLFTSEGVVDIIKIVQYELVGKYRGKAIFNLGFGDWDITNQVLNDAVISQNGDQYKVLNTVLSTIPSFFDRYPSAIIMVQGSDSLPSYSENCKINCRKKCSAECRNAHRRINIYKGYIDKNYSFLEKQYKFSGANLNDSGKIVAIGAYFTDNSFHIIFVEKR